MAKGTENSRQLSSRDPHPQTFPLSHLLSHWQTCWVHTMWQACPRCCGHRSHQWEGTPALRWCSREQNAVWGRAAVWRKHGRGVRNTRILEVCSLVFRNCKRPRWQELWDKEVSGEGDADRRALHSVTGAAPSQHSPQTTCTLWLPSRTSYSFNFCSGRYYWQKSSNTQ